MDMVIDGGAAAEKKPHLAVLPSPGMGHLTPLLEFAKRLVIHHGFCISFLVITTSEPPSPHQEKLLSSTNLPSDLHVVRLPPVDLAAVDKRLLARLFHIIRESFESVNQVLTQLSNRNNQQPLKALIIDMFTADAQDICRGLSIPVYSFYTSSPTQLSFHIYASTLEHASEQENVLTQPQIVRIPGCKPINFEGLDGIPDVESGEFKWCLLQYRRLLSSAGILINAWEDLDPTTLQGLRENLFFKKLNPPSIHPIGPLIKDKEEMTLTTDDSSDSALLEWLDKQNPESVVFVSLGSSGILSSEQLNEFAWGLEISQSPFIWVVRPPSDGESSGNYFGNNGSKSNVVGPEEYLPQGFLERTRERGLVVPWWAQQVTILRHPSTGGFLSHCGWNSVLEGIVHGVPIIAWPLFADQRQNAEFLADVDRSGVAVRVRSTVERGIVERKEVERAVRLVMEGKEGMRLRQRVKKLKESALKAGDSGGSSYETLSCMVKKWSAVN